MWKFLGGVMLGLIIGVSISEMTQPSSTMAVTAPIVTVARPETPRTDCSDRTKKDLLWTDGAGFECVDKPAVACVARPDDRGMVSGLAVPCLERGVPATQTLYHGIQFSTAPETGINLAPATSIVVCARITPDGLIATSYQPCRADPKTGECVGECVALTGGLGPPVSVGKEP